LKILIDGQSDLLSLNPGASGAGLLDHIDGLITSSGRVTKTLTYNGNLVEPETLQQTWDQQTPQGQLDVETVSLRAHLLGHLNDLGAGIGQSEENLSSISEGLTQLNSSGAEGQLAQWCIDISSTCGNLGDMANLLNIDIKELIIDGESLAQLLHRIIGHCDILTQQLKAQQKVACADLIECDIAPEMPKLKKALDTFCEAVENILPEKAA
jgi:hypothetical protein